MDLLKNNHKKTNQDGNEEQEEDSVELPADTLAILREFLQNKDMQKTLNGEETFEEDWVHTIFHLHEIQIQLFYVCFFSSN